LIYCQDSMRSVSYPHLTINRRKAHRKEAATHCLTEGTEPLPDVKAQAFTASDNMDEIVEY
jgi:hypothetical protein